jgi:hypothetical protein
MAKITFQDIPPEKAAPEPKAAKPSEPKPAKAAPEPKAKPAKKGK